MKKLWAFVSNPRNLAVLVALGGGLAFLIREGLALRTADRAPQKPSVTQEARANGGVAVNAAEGSEVKIGSANHDDPTPKGSDDSPAASETAPSGQRAEATEGGTAVNAAPSAKVQVTGPADQN